MASTEYETAAPWLPEDTLREVAAFSARMTVDYLDSDDLPRAKRWAHESRLMMTEAQRVNDAWYADYKARKGIPA